jgi:hypothetical protein
MNGGMLDAVRRVLESGALDDADRAEALELDADRRYARILQPDEALST